MTVTFEKLRDYMFGSDDRHVYLHVGHFMLWFAAAEVGVTLLLALATRSIDIKGFRQLVRGMDARVKCERLRSAAKDYKPIGPNLATRLEFFEKTMVKTRNLLTHSAVLLPEPRQMIYFASFGAFGTHDAPPDYDGDAAPSMEAIELFKQGLWLNSFHTDLESVAREDAHSTTLEIDHPRSPTPTEFRSNPLP